MTFEREITPSTEVGQILVLKPRYVPGIPDTKETGHTNGWCITTVLSTVPEIDNY